jgi:hypothetical protein
VVAAASRARQPHSSGDRSKPGCMQRKASRRRRRDPSRKPVRNRLRIPRASSETWPRSMPPLPEQRQRLGAAHRPAEIS